MAVGDHLVVSLMWYRHHGIDVGEGMVVHFGRGLHDLESAKVEMVTREEFSGGRPVQTIESEAVFPAEMIRERAISRLGETGYNLETNNCEHFAHWCRTGRHESRQSDCGETLARQAMAAISKPLLARSVGTAISIGGARMAAKSLAPLLTKPLSRAVPGLLVADAIQTVTECVATRSGCSKEESRLWGTGAGASISLAVGVAAAGGPGGLATLATWAVGQKLANGVIHRWNQMVHAKSDRADSE